jgi:hypothetical protein
MLPVSPKTKYGYNFISNKQRMGNDYLSLSPVIEILKIYQLPLHVNIYTITIYIVRKIEELNIQIINKI